MSIRTNEPPLSARFIVSCGLLLSFLIDDISSGERFSFSLRTKYFSPCLTTVLNFWQMSVVAFSMSSIILLLSRNVPYLNNWALLGVQVDFSVKVLIVGSNILVEPRKADLIFMLRINLLLFSKTVEIGSSLGLGMKFKPFARRLLSASVRCADDRFTISFLLFKG